MKLIDKLLDRLADKVVERMENKNTIKIDGHKLREKCNQVEYDEEMLGRIFRGRKGAWSPCDITLTRYCDLKSFPQTLLHQHTLLDTHLNILFV